VVFEDDVHILTVAQAEGVSEGQRAISCIWRTAGVRDSSPAIQKDMYGHSCVFSTDIDLDVSHPSWSGAKLVPGPIAGRRNVC
jgi:hypothetical protein